MAPRQITDRIAHRASKLTAVAVLAVGVLGTALAPSAAFAQEGFSDLTANPAYKGTFVPGQRDMVPIVVENKDRSTKRVFSVKVLISKGFEDIVVRPAVGQKWRCFTMVVDAQTGVTAVTCQTDGLEADSHKALLVTATAQDAEDLWMVSIADPQNRVMESNEENNVGKKALGSAPWVTAPQYHDSGYRPNG
jgi:hypothetical protein